MGNYEMDIVVRVEPESGGRYVDRDRAVQRSIDCVSFVGRIGQQDNVLRAEDGANAHGERTGRDLRNISVEKSRVGRTRAFGDCDNLCLGIKNAAGFHEGYVPILADTRNGQIQSSSFLNLFLVAAGLRPPTLFFFT